MGWLCGLDYSKFFVKVIIFKLAERGYNLLVDAKAAENGKLGTEREQLS